jgi:hypothetical protein
VTQGFGRKERGLEGEGMDGLVPEDVAAAVLVQAAAQNKVRVLDWSLCLYPFFWQFLSSLVMTT